MSATASNSFELRPRAMPPLEPAPGFFQPPELSDDELTELDRAFDSVPASEVIAWAAESFGPALSLAASMTDAVLIDLATKVAPAIEVVFIGTGYHFPETLDTVELVRRRYGLNLKMMTVPPRRPGQSPHTAGIPIYRLHALHPRSCRGG